MLPIVLKLFDRYDGLTAFYSLRIFLCLISYLRDLLYFYVTIFKLKLFVWITELVDWFDKQKCVKRDALGMLSDVRTKSERKVRPRREAL